MKVWAGIGATSIGGVAWSRRLTISEGVSMWSRGGVRVGVGVAIVVWQAMGVAWAQSGNGDSGAVIRARGESGDAAAQFVIGLAYEAGGRWDELASTEAGRWFWERRDASRAARAALDHLELLMNGEGESDQSWAEAKYWYSRSARQGFPLAQFRLGYVYGQMAGGPEDAVSSYMWYGIAASLAGEPTASEANEVVGRLERVMSTEELAAAKTATAEMLEGFEPGQAGRERLVPFLEGTDVFWTLGSELPLPGDSEGKWPYYALEADIFPHLIAYQSFTNLLVLNPSSALAERKRWSVSGTPAVRIRMSRADSNPVRTPSYMPRVNFQYVVSAETNRGERVVPSVMADEEARGRGEALAVRLLEVHFQAGHHSNGQAGCIVSGVEGECPDVDAQSNGAAINKVNGSFSTNYLRGGVNFARSRWDAARPENFAEARSEFRFRLDYERHVGTGSKIARYYTGDKIQFEVGYARRGVRWCGKRVEVKGGVGLNLRSSEQKMAGTPTGWVVAQVSCFSAESGGWGTFVRYYGGQDYYNVNFLSSIHRLHAGVTFNQAGFFRVFTSWGG